MTVDTAVGRGNVASYTWCRVRAMFIVASLEDVAAWDDEMNRMHRLALTIIQEAG